MFASSLLAASSLVLTTALADSSPYSKFVNDANSLLAAATGSDAAQLDALYSWQATQTAIPSSDVDSQYQKYLDAYMTTTSAPLPVWVTAVPSSLQPIATSFLQAEASLVVQDIAPLVSQNNVALSLYSAGQAAPTTTSSNTLIVPTSAPSATASTGFVIGPANMTTSQMSGNGTAPTVSAKSTATALTTSITTALGSPTKSVTQPKTTAKTGGAEKPAGVALAAAVVGIMGIVVLL
ncbi:MAG: hypothetical protein ASARMPREDX12_007077 [Alectoria sarmentosa]|nr:MAG: hypothetical protein ASARMPREDX12_007077 [Alectoria sarmentosa]